MDPFDNVRSVQRMILDEQGYEVDTATDLEEAAALWGSTTYQVVITEYFFPVEKTLSFVRFLKGQSPQPFHLLSTSTPIDDQICKGLFDAGLDDLLVKPYGREFFLTHIKKGLEQQALSQGYFEKEHQGRSLPSQMDVLGVLEPHYFSRFIRREIKKARRHQESMSLILVRLPKKDQMGQEFDLFYNELTGLLRKSLREEDLVGRENGHLGIVLEKTDETGSQVLGKRLLSLIQTHPTFQAQASWQSAIRDLAFNYYTYPNPSNVPEIINTLLQEMEADVRIQ
ncbi:MAG: response regulator [Thermodesulfobacteriota bacterium]